ncbi:DUF6545 domain-containing protein [Cryobacterium sp. TMS1-13-1]|uniref:DUF6545 domain-containing protein n=1 Tax=Cryobacterium sp. TMS1-13-1 TaxID=1259220 RepID=UPI00106A3E0D|nr:DUF6545 domain-containing protein [Cryobacterium sp. TMS1-13-1]TFD23313.1 hypothetical protein E3T31_04975 [Cryobacterium sp. TMS1-13-1]
MEKKIVVQSATPRMLESGLCGLWIAVAGESFGRIHPAPTTSPVHRQQFLNHEFGHMILDHDKELIPGRIAYSLSLLLSPISLVIGLGLTATVDGLTSSGRNFRDRVLLWRITPLWQRLLADTPELSIERELSPLQRLIARVPGAHLYRRRVEIRDSLLLHPEQAVSPAERGLIDLAEVRTQAPSPANHTPVVGTPR